MIYIELKTQHENEMFYKSQIKLQVLNFVFNNKNILGIIWNEILT